MQKQRYRIHNWAEHNKALIKRGSITAHSKKAAILPIPKGAGFLAVMG
jgi:hypothetical protein